MIPEQGKDRPIFPIMSIAGILIIRSLKNEVKKKEKRKNAKRLHRKKR